MEIWVPIYLCAHIFGISLILCISGNLLYIIASVWLHHLWYTWLKDFIKRGWPASRLVWILAGNHRIFDFETVLMCECKNYYENLRNLIRCKTNAHFFVFNKCLFCFSFFSSEDIEYDCDHPGLDIFVQRATVYQPVLVKQLKCKGWNCLLFGLHL